MDIKLRPYKKEFEYSYAVGVSPTLELLSHHPAFVLKVVVSAKSSMNAGVAKIIRLCQTHSISVEVSDRLISRLAGKGNCYAVGVFNKYETAIDPCRSHVVLVGIRDMGNLGTICRTMLGFGMHDLAIIKPAADIFAPKTIRASMGAIFQMNVSYFDSVEGYTKAFTNTIYSFMTDGQKSLADTSFKEPYALIFGSEASGLDKRFHEIGTSVRIPQGDNVDSLNLSVAVGIALYAARR